MKLSWTFPLLWEYLSGYVSWRAVFHFVENGGQILSDRFWSTGMSLSLRWQAANLGLSRLFVDWLPLVTRCQLLGRVTKIMELGTFFPTRQGLSIVLPKRKKIKW